MRLSGHSNTAQHEAGAGLPRQVAISTLIESRYPDNQRPQSWDERCSGIDIAVTDSGEVLRLLSDAGQSPPQPGWVLVLHSGDPQHGFRWTLYGLPRGSKITKDS